MVRNYKRKTEDKWTKADLLEALTLIQYNKLKINDAARQFGISRATLYRQFQKFAQSGGKFDLTQFRTCGGNPILTKVEEDVLEKTIMDLRDQGFPVTSNDIKRICFEYCATNSIPNQFSKDKRMASDDWYYGYLKRHPDLRSPQLQWNTSSGCEFLDLDIALDVKPKRRTIRNSKYKPRQKPTILKGKRSGQNSARMVVQIKQENPTDFLKTEMDMEEASMPIPQETTEIMMGVNNGGDGET